MGRTAGSVFHGLRLLELPQPAVPARATTIHRPRCHALPKRRRHVAACQLLLPGCDRNPQPDAGAPYRQSRPVRRLDYKSEIFGGAPTAHLASKHEATDGITFPLRREIVPRGQDGSAASGPR